MHTQTRLLPAYATLLLCTTSATTAFAHHPGGPGNTGGSGPINTISASTLPPGMSVVSVVYDHMEIDPLSDATLTEEAAHAAEHGEEHAHIHSLDSLSSPSLNFAYGVTNDLTVSVRLPYVTRRGIREGHVHEHENETGGHHEEGEEHGEQEVEAEAHNRGGSSGIGDLSVLGQWRFLNNQASGFEAAALIGLKAPTGNTDEDDRDGERFDAEFQPGSGSWDGMFGLALTQRSGKWSFDASVLYTAVTEGTQDTDLGDRLNYGVGVSYRLLGGATGGTVHRHSDGSEHVHQETATGPALDAILELNGEWHDKQEIGGEEDANTGGHVLYISPGARLSMDKWSAFASVGIPIVNDMNGIQAEPDWRVVSGITLGF